MSGLTAHIMFMCVRYADHCNDEGRIQELLTAIISGSLIFTSFNNPFNTKSMKLPSGYIYWWCDLRVESEFGDLTVLSYRSFASSSDISPFRYYFSHKKTEQRSCDIHILVLQLSYTPSRSNTVLWWRGKLVRSWICTWLRCTFFIGYQWIKESNQ